MKRRPIECSSHFAELCPVIDSRQIESEQKRERVKYVFLEEQHDLEYPFSD